MATCSDVCAVTKVSAPCLKCKGTGRWWKPKRERKLAVTAADKMMPCPVCSGSGARPAVRERPSKRRRVAARGAEIGCGSGSSPAVPAATSGHTPASSPHSSCCSEARETGGGGASHTTGHSGARPPESDLGAGAGAGAGARAGGDNGVTASSTEHAGDTHDRHRTRRFAKNARKLRAKKVRNGAMVAWLLERVGVDQLARGGGVLDVAGGKGRISSALAMNHNVPATVVDPADVVLGQRTSRDIINRAAWKAGVFTTPGGGGDNDRAFPRAAPAASEAASATAASSSEHACGSEPRPHAQVFAPSATWLHPKSRSGVCLPAQTDEAGRTTRPPASPDVQEAAVQAAVEELTAAGLHHVKDVFDASFSTRHPGIWGDCSFCLGMHPDQATDAIVDLSLAAGKPFAVVPCCVFPRLFSDRRGPGGEPVKSYEQLLDYLQAKDPGIRRETLPGVPGRNIVLYKLAGAHEKASAPTATSDATGGGD